jgi:hypothetical protein
MRHTIILIGVLALGGCATTQPLRLQGGTEEHLVVQQSGLYVTAADFDARRVTGAISCVSATRPVDRDAFAGTDDISWGDPKSRYAKAQIFGFRACDGTDVRFSRGWNLRVVRAAPLYLYQHEYRERMGKSGYRLAADYFFSTTPSDSVRPLTIDALKRAYPENHRFHDLLDVAFRSDGELMHYDDFHHEYRVARMLRESLEQTVAPRAK